MRLAKWETKRKFPKIKKGSLSLLLAYLFRVGESSVKKGVDEVHAGLSSEVHSLFEDTGAAQSGELSVAWASTDIMDVQPNEMSCNGGGG